MKIQEIHVLAYNVHSVHITIYICTCMYIILYMLSLLTPLITGTPKCIKLGMMGLPNENNTGILTSRVQWEHTYQVSIETDCLQIYIHKLWWLPTNRSLFGISDCWIIVWNSSMVRPSSYHNKPIIIMMFSLRSVITVLLKSVKYLQTNLVIGTACQIGSKQKKRSAQFGWIMSILGNCYHLRGSTAKDKRVKKCEGVGDRWPMGIIASGKGLLNIKLILVVLTKTFSDQIKMKRKL